MSSYHYPSKQWIPHKVKWSVKQLLIPIEVNLLMKIPMEDLDYPHPINSPSKWWWCMMKSFYDARWLSSTNKYCFCFSWGNQDLLSLYDDCYIHVDFYFSYYFELLQWFHELLLQQYTSSMIPSSTKMHIVIILLILNSMVDVFSPPTSPVYALEKP